VCAYLFLIVAARALGVSDDAPLSALWAAQFLVGPGVFLAMEQELARGLAADDGRDDAGRIGGSTRLAGGIGVALGLVVVLARGPLARTFFDGESTCVWALAIGVLGYAAQHIVRGWAAGTGRFRHYGVVVAGESVLRLVGGVVLSLAGTQRVGPYALVLGAAPLAAAVALLPWRHIRHGRVRDHAAALPPLVAGAFTSQLLLNITPVAAAALATAADYDVVGPLLAVLVVVQAPVFLYAAVQASLLPRMSALLASGRAVLAWRELRRLSAVLLVLGAVLALAAAALGPWAVRTFFGGGFALGRRHFVITAAASVLYMLAMTFAQALLALRRRAWVAVAWALGGASYGAVLLAPADLLLRVERALLVGCAVGCLAMAVLLTGAVNRHGSAAEHAAAR
jgi:O-antigen/teichoic acid export membrane protein